MRADLRGFVPSKVANEKRAIRLRRTKMVEDRILTEKKRKEQEEQDKKKEEEEQKDKKRKEAASAALAAAKDKVSFRKCPPSLPSPAASVPAC